MMTAFRAFLLAAVWSVSSAAKAADWPLYFDAIIKDRYILVVLHEGGRAQYFDRMIQTEKGRPTENVFIQHDDNATWGSFQQTRETKGVILEPVGKDGKSVIYVRTNQFRFDYYLEKDRLTEFDKMGVQCVLKKRKNTNLPPP